MTTAEEVVAQGDSGMRKEESPGEVSQGGQAQTRAGARTGAILYARLRGSSKRSLITLGSWLAGIARRLAGCSPYADRPASIRDVVDYTRQGGWVPGEHPWWVEAPGYAYGALVAIPVTVALYAIAWVLQRPSRLILACLVALLLAVAW